MPNIVTKVSQLFTDSVSKAKNATKSAFINDKERQALRGRAYGVIRARGRPIYLVYPRTLLGDGEHTFIVNGIARKLTFFEVEKL